MSVPGSSLARYFKANSAGSLPAGLRTRHAQAVASALSNLAQRIPAGAPDNPYADLLEFCEPEPLAALLNDLALHLGSVLDTQTPPIPKWVSVAQNSREHVDFADLSALVERVVAHIVPTLDASCQSFVALNLWDVQAAFDVFRQRFQIGAEAEAISSEVFAGMAHAMSLLEESTDANSLQELELALSTTLKQWSALVGDMGVVVDLELIRGTLQNLVFAHRLSPRVWSLLLLRLDRALAIRVPDGLAHAFVDAIEAMLAATQRFDLLRDLSHDAHAYLPPDCADWADLNTLLLLAGLRPDSSLGVRISRALDPIEVNALLEERAPALATAVRLGSAALRGRWERNHLDLYTDSADKLSEIARAGSDMRALGGSTLLKLSTQALLIQARAAVALGTDVQSRRSLFRITLAQLHEVPSAGDLRRAQALLPALSADAQAALRDLFDLVPLSLHQSADLSPASVRLLAHALAPDDAQIEKVLGLFGALHRIFDEHLARAQMRAELARLMCEGGPERRAAAVDGLNAVLAYLRLSPHWKSGELARLLGAFEPSLIAVSAAVKIKRQAQEMADTASTSVLSAWPEYAERIGASGCAATRRDNFFTILRLAQVLGGASAAPKESMIWWWLSTIGVYLYNRDQAVMQGNLRALLNALQSALTVDEYLLVTDILAGVYRAGLAIDIPRDLGNGDVLSFSAFAECGPLWRKAFSMPREWPAHHAAIAAQLARAAADSPETKAVQQLWIAFGAAWQKLGDPWAAWSAQAEPMVAALRTFGMARLERAWLAAQADLDGVEGAVPQLLLSTGLERLQRVAFGVCLGAQRNSLAATMASLSPNLAETPPALAASYEHKGQRDLAGLLGLLADAAQGNDNGLSALNAGRYLVQCILPNVSFSQVSWQRLWGVACAQLLPALAPTVASQALVNFAVLAAVSAQAAEFGAIGQGVFVPASRQFSDDPVQEAHWRDFIGGLLVATAASAAGLPGEAMAQQLALASALFEEDPQTLWADAQEPLRGLLIQAMKPALHVALDRCMAAITRTLAVETVFQGAPASSALDLALSLRCHEPDALLLWRAERITRVKVEGLTTPLPGDLILSRATSWLCPDMVSIRRALAHWGEAELACAGSRGGFANGLRRIASHTAHLREGMSNPRATELAAALLAAEWSGLSIDQLTAGLGAAAQTLREALAEDALLPDRLGEIADALWLPLTALAVLQAPPRISVRGGATELAQANLALWSLRGEAAAAAAPSAEWTMITRSDWFSALTRFEKTSASAAIGSARSHWKQSA